MGTAPRLNSTILRAGAFLPLPLRCEDVMINISLNLTASAHRRQGLKWMRCHKCSLSRLCARFRCPSS